jgi:hypothetical protein
MRLGRWAVLALGIAAAACASTIGPVVPSIQVLVVLDSIDDTLRIIPVDTPNVMHKVPLNIGIAEFGKHALALRGPLAAIGNDRTAILFYLSSPQHQQCAPGVTLDASGSIVSLAFADNNGQVYAAITTDSAPHFDPVTCGVGQGYVRGGPRAFVNARSTFFVVTGGSAAFSWLATTTGQSNSGTPLSPADSIPLSLPGNAQGAVFGSDGFLYVINAGSGLPNARLSQVNPISLAELSVIPGFGTLPQFIATDGADRVLVASAADGLMVYNIRTNTVERGASAAIPLFGTPRGLAADDLGRVYALIAGSCGTAPVAPGRVQVLGADLVNTRLVTVGRCPVAIGVTDIPATLYHFAN